MRTPWRKALRDLWGERARSAGVVVALAVGIAGFFAVLSSYAILLRALDEGYAATDPPSAVLSVERLDDTQVQAAAATPGVAVAEARRTVRGQVRSADGRWRDLVLFVRRDFEASHVGTLSPESGSWPPGPGELTIERDALQVAQTRVGETVTVRTDHGQERALRVSGTVHDVGQAQARMENLVYGYVTLETLRSLGEEALYDELVIRVAERTLDEAHIREVADSVAATIADEGSSVVRISVPEPGRHPHAKLMELMLLAMAIFGLFVLALSGVLVFNVLTALLAGQARQIGVMKALGGSRLQVAGVYLLEALLLGVAASGLALPAGTLVGRWLCDVLAVFLNFDIVSYAVPLWIWALVVAVGLLVPVSAALLPVWLGTRGPVREALASTGTSSRPYGSSALDRALTSVGGVSRVWLLALRNAGRNRSRVALTLVTLSAGGIFFMSALNVRQSMVHTLDRLFEGWRSDLTVSLPDGTPVDAALRATRGLEGVTAAEGWIVVQGQTTVIGLPPGSELITFDLSYGEGLGADASGMVANTPLFEALGRPAVGSEVHLPFGDRQASVRLLGVTQEVISTPAAYVSRAFFDGRPEAGTANSLRLALADPNPASLAEVETALDQKLAGEGIRSLAARTEAENRYVFDEHMLVLYVFLLAVSGILGVVGALGLVTTVSLNVTERRREMGVLRAIGATPARTMQIVVLEGVVLASVAWLVAALCAWPMGELIGDLMLGLMFSSAAEIAVAVEPAGIVIWLVVSLVGSALASIWPAWQASRAPIREALTYE
ncbi:MAG: FtsX-like permease family protein [Myxococcota bacterium]